MRKLAIAVALASTAMATPAVARDHSFYAGLEGGLGYKRASVNQLNLDSRLSGDGPLANFDASGRSRALSAMINFLLDFGNEDGLSGYAGAGIGIADVKMDAFAAGTPNGVV